MFLPALKPYLWAIKLGIAALIIGGVWWHGYSTARDSAEQEAQAGYTAKLEQTLVQQAEVARTMGLAVESAHTREAEMLLAKTQIEQRAANREQFWRSQRATSPGCDAFMRDPVPCRLREPAASGGH